MNNEYKVFLGFLATILVLGFVSAEAYSPAENMGGTTGLAVTMEKTDLGEFEPGDTYSGSLYISSHSEYEEFDSYEVTIGSETRFLEEYEGRQDQTVNHYDPSEWFDFPENVGLNRFKTEVYEIEEGEDIEVDKRLDYELDIPQDAEPGLYSISIIPNSDFSGGYRRDNLLFSVKGEANREVNLESIEVYNASKEEYVTKIKLRNTGSVTSEVSDGTIFLRDSADQKLTSINLESNVKIDGSKNNYVMRPGKSTTLAYRSEIYSEIGEDEVRPDGEIKFHDYTIQVDEEVQIRQDYTENSGSKQYLDYRSTAIGNFFSSSINFTTLILLGLITVLFGYIYRSW